MGSVSAKPEILLWHGFRHDLLKKLEQNPEKLVQFSKFSLCDVNRLDLKKVPDENRENKDSAVFLGRLAVNRDKIIPVVYKIFLTPRKTDNTLYTEVRLHANYVNALLDLYATPCFTRFLGYADCPDFADDILSEEYQNKILSPDVKQYIKKLTEEKIFGITLAKKSEREDEVSIHTLVTEQVIDAVTLEDWFSLSNIQESDCKSLYFELMYTLMVMNLASLRHHDLHWKNILIERSNFPVQRFYVFQDTEDGTVKYVRINSSFQPKIFDWDWGAAKTVQNNVLKTFCEDSIGLCNIGQATKLKVPDSDARDVMYVFRNTFLLWKRHALAPHHAWLEDFMKFSVSFPALEVLSKLDVLKPQKEFPWFSRPLAENINDNPEIIRGVLNTKEFPWWLKSFISILKYEGFKNFYVDESVVSKQLQDETLLFSPQQQLRKSFLNRWAMPIEPEKGPLKNIPESKKIYERIKKFKK